MLKSIKNPENLVRFRMSVSVPPESQAELTYIYKVFKDKVQSINRLQLGDPTLQRYTCKPLKQVYYRQSLGKDGVGKFGKFIDMAYHLGKTLGEKHIDPQVVLRIYQIKISNLMRSITGLKGILRLSQYNEIFYNEANSELSVSPEYKYPHAIDANTQYHINHMNSQLTKATRAKPYFDVAPAVEGTSFSNLYFDHFDFQKNFQVSTVQSLIGKEALDVKEDEEDEEDEILRDQLLYGFNGFKIK